ncbi:MAG: hypothetical protein ACTS2F_11670 [Thainema sp.]
MSKKPDSSSNKKRFQIPKLKNGLVIKSKGAVKFFTTSFGATIAFPFMIFNGLTTIAGAKLILPIAIGYPIGLLLSATYIIIVSSVRVRDEYPLRRIILICIFGVGSTYTSFFSIYNQMSGGQLEYQSAERTVTAHNRFIDDVRTTLNRQINQIESADSQLAEVNYLKLELSEITQQRAEFERSGQKDSAGELAGRIIDIKARLEMLREIENSYRYKLYQSLLRLRRENESLLVNSLSTQSFIESNSSPSQIFAEDESLYKDVLITLDEVNKEISINLGEDYLKPNYDNYIKTPIFLVPIEAATEGGRQLSFIFFAVMIAIIMEIIPIAISGIHLSSEDESKKWTEDNLDSDQAELEEKPITERDKGSDQIKQYKTTINQISSVVSSFVYDFKKAWLEIYNSITQGVGTTDNVRNMYAYKLLRAMLSVRLNPNERYKFLILFYASIDRSNREISLIKFPHGEDLYRDQDSRFRIAASLMLDIMQDKRIGWLKKNGSDKYVKSDDSKYDIPVEEPSLFDVPVVDILKAFVAEKSLSEHHGSTDMDLKEKNEIPEMPKWKFTDETAYQDFLDWWFDMQCGPKSVEQNSERLHAQLELEINHAVENHYG